MSWSAKILSHIQQGFVACQYIFFWGVGVWVVGTGSILNRSMGKCSDYT